MSIHALEKPRGDSFHPDLSYSVLLFLFLPPESQHEVSKMVTPLPAGKTEREGGETETCRMFVAHRNELNEDFTRNL